MNLVEIVLACCLAGWFLVSILHQFHRGALTRHLSKYDVLALIPTWTFFAPRPGITDTHLFYRDRSFDGSLGPWREAFLPRRAASQAFWHPEKRLRKSIHDWATALVRSAAKHNGDRRILLDTAYVALLTTVCTCPNAEDTEMRQFLLANVTPLESPDARILFVSEFHKLRMGQ